MTCTRVVELTLISIAVFGGSGCQHQASRSGARAPLHGEASVPVATATDGNHPPAEAYPGWLRAPSTLPYDFLWQQRVTVAWGEHARGFDAALQKQGDTLTLIGLAPLGTPAFVITLEGETLTFKNNTDEELPFSPRYIMLDVQRVFYPWLTDEATRSKNAEENVIERLDAGHLAERRFRRKDGQPPGDIVVTYEGWSAGADAPATATLDNGWFGYRLTVETVAQQRL